MFDSSRTVSLDEANKELVIINQTLLPNKVEFMHLSDTFSIRNAIKDLCVRGAPAIGVAAAIGIYVISLRFKASDYISFLKEFSEAKEILSGARPTAVNLSWALERMDRVVKNHSHSDIEQIKELLHKEALSIMEEDIRVCSKIGEFGGSLINCGDGILTHCNAGSLAAVKYGTALAPIYFCHESGKKIKVYADETRPLLQGARLTAFELKEAGIDVTLICDNMSSYVMSEGLIQSVFVGCDRVAANGDIANKIGTSAVAILADYYNIPFYVCAPFSTIDSSCPNGKSITIEQRNPLEVTDLWYKERMAPKDISVCNPAFDITPSSLITAIITEKGIYYPPYKF